MGAAVGVDVYDSGVSGGVAVGAVLEDVGGVVAEWVVEVSQVLFRLSRWENLEYAKKI